MDTTMIDRQVLVDSNHKHKVDSQQHQLIQLQHSHHINQAVKVVTTIQVKQTQISQQHHQVVQLDIHQVHNNVQQMSVLVHMHHHKVDQLHIQDKDNLKDQELAADHSVDQLFQAQAVSVKEILLVVDSKAVLVQYLHHHLHQVDHHQANKMKAKMEITQPVPENQMLTIQFTQKFQKLHSTVTNKNIQDTMLMLKLDVKSSISVP